MSVRLRLLIADDGRVLEATVLSAPNEAFGEAARKRLLSARFKPAISNGKPVASEINFTVRFERED